MRKIVLPIRRVLAAYARGDTMAEIAAKYGTTRSTVQRRLTASGHPLRRTGPRLMARTIRMPSDPALLGYIAGLFDGEGNIGLRLRANGTRLPRAAIYSTTAEVIDWLAATMGGNVRWDRTGVRVRVHGWKPMGTWTIWRVNDVRAFLAALMPYLIIKRDPSRSVLSAIEPLTEIERAQ